MQNKRTGIEIFLILAVLLPIILRSRSSFCNITAKFTLEASFLVAALITSEFQRTI